jgi:hypothetical protein
MGQLGTDAHDRRKGVHDMQFSMLERRAYPRRHADLPITLRCDGADRVLPAHLLDYSRGGAAVLTTANNAPELGHYVHLQFETPTNDGAAEGRPREELAVVINVRRPEREVVRIGVRFVHRLEFGSRPVTPQDFVDDHFTRCESALSGDRWSFLKEPSRPASSRPTLAGAR